METAQPAQITEWNTSSITTTGGVVNIYDAPASTTIFEASITSPPPSPTLSRYGVLSHIAAGGWWSTVITLIDTSTTSELIQHNQSLGGGDWSSRLHA
jgi:hypothetical protein